MSSSQISEAHAFYVLEPYGFYTFSTIAAQIHNIFRGKKTQSAQRENFAIMPMITPPKKMKTSTLKDMLISAFKPVKKKKLKQKLKEKKNG